MRQVPHALGISSSQPGNEVMQIERGHSRNHQNRSLRDDTLQIHLLYCH
ncbi:hypothetical protein [Marinobacter similis]|nr:hypothetical protein [Marinobacter similis]